MDYESLISFIVKSLVDNPEEVKIKVMESDNSTFIELSVNKDDLGKVIGKKGRIARAIRTLLSASASKLGKRVVLEILD